MNEIIPHRAELAVGNRGIEVSSIDDLWRLAKAVVAGGFAPRGLETAEKCLAAMATGMELGIPPMSALRGIAVINGRPSVYGDLAVSLVHSSGAMEYIVETIEGSGDGMTAVCKVKRVGRPNEVIRTFSVMDAKRAGLWGKAGPWTQYPKRMLQMRARSFALRDEFADVLLGMYLAEEAQDIEPERTDPRPINVRVLDQVKSAMPDDAEIPDQPKQQENENPHQSNSEALKSEERPEPPPEETNAGELQPEAVATNPWDTPESLLAAINKIAADRGHGPEVVEAALKLSGWNKKIKKMSADQRRAWHDAAQAGEGFFRGLEPK